MRILDFLSIFKSLYSNHWFKVLVKPTISTGLVRNALLIPKAGFLSRHPWHPYRGCFCASLFPPFLSSFCCVNALSAFFPRPSQRQAAVCCPGRACSWTPRRKSSTRRREWWDTRQRDWRGRTRSRPPPCWPTTPQLRREPVHGCKTDSLNNVFDRSGVSTDRSESA